MIDARDGVQRFLLDEIYKPYPMQQSFHTSPARHKLLGGAAGPGKTTCLIMEHMVAANEFADPGEASQVHTLLLRRTHPKLEATLITRFLEKVPRELYSHFNQSKKVVTWHNGATTHFGSMQYEHNAWDWQGQWYKIGYDELGEFTFTQWQATGAWNRCPVSPYATKDGASNPIGVGAGWIKSLFVDGKPCDEMDGAQKQSYRRQDYEYFPCTYLDNPVYAHDPVFLANLESYPAAIRDALKFGTWGLVGGYFAGAWDEAANVYEPDTLEIKPWWPRWISGDWGFEHGAPVYWHCIDDFGVIRTYREFLTNHEPPETLAESIVKHSYDEDGSVPKFVRFFYSHDAFAQRTDPNTIAVRMDKVLRAAGLPTLSNAGTDKIGREQLMYQLLKNRIRTGESATGQRIEEAQWQIASTCKGLIAKIPLAPRDDKKLEQIAKFTGDDPLDGAGYGIYGWLGRQGSKPREVQLQEALADVAPADFNRIHMTRLLFDAAWKKKNEPIKRGLGWRRES